MARHRGAWGRESGTGTARNGMAGADGRGWDWPDPTARGMTGLAGLGTAREAVNFGWPFHFASTARQ